MQINWQSILSIICLKLSMISTIFKVGTTLPYAVEQIGDKVNVR